MPCGYGINRTISEIKHLVGLLDSFIYIYLTFLILYSIGSKSIPAAELTLLSLTEVIGGIFWVWIPILGINEIPSQGTVIGGFFIFLAIIYYSLIIRTNRRFIGLN